MLESEALRQRIIEVAAELFAEKGYGGTKLRMVAARANVKPGKVRRLTGSRAQLFAAVLTAKLTSKSADLVAAAAANPEAAPPLSVLLEAAAEIFAAPERSWSALELEALIRAHRDDDVRALEAARVHKRWANMQTVLQQIRLAGGVDPDVDVDALVHFALALSVGLALVDPVVDRQPRQADWNALMARVSAAFAPAEPMLTTEHEPRNPWRIRIDIPDQPGGLARLIRSISTLHVSVVATTVLATGDGTRTIDLAVSAPAAITAQGLLAAAMAAGRHGYVTSGSPDAAVDLPTRVLDVAAELVTNPGSAPLAVATLVEADHFEVTDAAMGADDAADILRLQWTADRHVVLHRDWAPFARAEKTRASALLRLAAAVATKEGDPDAIGWVEPIGAAGTVWIRLARPEDADAVAAMHERCSQQSLYLRYLSGVGEWRELALRWLSGGHRGATLAVMNEGGAIVGLGHVFPDVSNDVDAAEIAVIVEDAYQHCGIGTRLVRHLLGLAERLGFDEVVATVLAQNTGMLRVLEATHLQWAGDIEEGVVTMRASLQTAEVGSQSSGTTVVPGATP